MLGVIFEGVQFLCAQSGFFLRELFLLLERLELFVFCLKEN